MVQARLDDRKLLSRASGRVITQLADERMPAQDEGRLGYPIHPRFARKNIFLSPILLFIHFEQEKRPRSCVEKALDCERLAGAWALHTVDEFIGTDNT